ncbi:hypothetical protein [Pedobacter steynii]|nr:hypothetical protein [Pedobacter steynii]
MEETNTLKALKQRIKILEKLLLEEVLKNDLLNEKLDLTNTKLESGQLI